MVGRWRVRVGWTAGGGGDTEWVKVGEGRMFGWKMEEGGTGEDDG